MSLSCIIIDDEPNAVNLLEILIHQTTDWQLLAKCYDALEAMAFLKKNKVDFIFLDINMPKMDGLQLLASLKGSPQWHNIPVVMITTEGGEAKVSEAVRLGAAGYVRKPFTADQIKEKLTGILEPVLPL